MSVQYDPIKAYLLEAEELLADIEACALSLSEGEPSAEIVNRLFRAFHTIKGSGAMCGFEKVAALTHNLENLLDRVREGAVPVSPRLAEVVLAAKDQIQALLASEQGGPGAPPDRSEKLARMIEELGMPATAARTAPEHAGPEPERTWNIRFRPDRNLIAYGGNPVLLFRDLRKLGPCEICAHMEDVPPLDRIQPELCYIWWTITLRSACDRDAIRDVFIFVEDGSEIAIEAVANEPGRQPEPALVEPSPEPAMQNSRAAEPHPLADGIPKVLRKESTVRVPAARLDSLVNLVGELVMNQSRIARAAGLASVPELANPVQELERLVAELRDNVLGIRMLPIGTIFGRFVRLVHDLSAELGKEVDLVTEGAETELDKSILDLLSEPLVHLLRNSIDHGIEPAQERIEKGKPRRGTVKLAAAHTGAHVVISVEDDGRGIDRTSVRAKAVERELIAPDANLSDKEILHLVLLPGFSTARQVTSVSGRGVGMDVVKRQIDALRGSLSIATEEGRGSRFSLTLPLTLAIIEGLLVQVGADQFIVPMAVITENVELNRAERTRRNGRNVVAVRGELVPYIDLREIFHVEGDAPPIAKIVLVSHDDQRVGLVVDRVIGTHQTVIQSLGKLLRHIQVVSGGTIMGDGRVALILDIPAVVRFADREGLAAPARATAPVAHSQNSK